LEPVFSRAYQGVGFNNEAACELAGRVREHMVKPDRFILYDDAIPVLAALKDKGWRHLILSNHMPELPDIVNALGLSPYIDGCLTSAVTGYEKPNPEAFRLALLAAGNPGIVWMVGDNIMSDVKGAEAVGIPAILVHTHVTEEEKHYAENLTDVIKMIEAEHR
jgi:putative hydrolase of the HAD superfamily